jgi:hypothetical protein
MIASIPFLQDTKRNMQKMADMPISAFNQNLQQDLPAAGLLSAVYVQVRGVIHTGTGTAGNWNPNYWPWNLLQKIYLRTNAGFNVFDNMSGYSTFLVNSLPHRGAQIVSPAPISGGFNNSSNVGPRTAISIFPTGALADSTDYPFNIWYKIPVTMDEALGVGLLLLANQYVKVTLECQIGSAADFGTLGSGATITAAIKPTPLVWSVPRPENYPVDSLNRVHIWQEVEKDWTASGEQFFDVLPSGTFTRIIADVQNNGAPEPFFGSASDPSSGNFGDTKVIWASNQSPEVIDFQTRLLMQREFYGMDLPQGVIVFDFATLQSVELGWNPTTSWNTDQATQFGVRINISDTPTAGKIRYIQERIESRK